MKKGYELILEIASFWKCKSCNKRQDWQENEEWPSCCNELMKVGMARQFKTGVIPNEKT